MLLPSISELPLPFFVMAVAHHLPSGQVREEPGIAALFQSSGPALLLLCYLAFLALAHPNMEEMKDCCYCACWCAFRLSFRKNTWFEHCKFASRNTFSTASVHRVIWPKRNEKEMVLILKCFAELDKHTRYVGQWWIIVCLLHHFTPP